jgi:hypothetical protein
MGVSAEMNASPILSEAEIADLCKPLTQHAAQARKLSALLGCPIKRRPDGLPIVTRSMLERLYQGAAQAQNDAGIIWSKRA